MTHRVFVANRGEIAVRVIEACDQLGYETVLGVSRADTDTLGARRAGRCVVLGGARPAESYLAMETVLHAAIATGCDAVHPGYGFLSERPAFARLCADNNVLFVGPSVSALQALGDKLTARRLAESLEVPVSAGGTAATFPEVRRIAERIGFPLLVKAAFGGGGRGMKLVDGPDDLAEAWSLASAEAESAFGDGTVFLERFVGNAKHVEVQIIGDRHGTVLHLGERECSVQYRYQKVVEEAPCVAIDDRVRELLHTSAVKIGRALEYVGLGTVEFLYDQDRGEINFLEVNPRVQVEHPVTEAVTGIDLVREQLLVAFGEPLSFAQDDVVLAGHAIECRVTAQDSDHGLRPSPGPVTMWRPPVGRGVRLDSHIYQGYKFPPYYDALMGKVVVWAADRPTAIANMESALDSFVVAGLTTSLPLLRRIIGSVDYRANSVTTSWLGGFIDAGTAA